MNLRVPVFIHFAPLFFPFDFLLLKMLEMFDEMKWVQRRVVAHCVDWQVG